MQELENENVQKELTSAAFLDNILHINLFHSGLLSETEKLVTASINRNKQGCGYRLTEVDGT